MQPGFLDPLGFFSFLFFYFKENREKRKEIKHKDNYNANLYKNYAYCKKRLK